MFSECEDVNKLPFPKDIIQLLPPRLKQNIFKAGLLSKGLEYYFAQGIICRTYCALTYKWRSCSAN
jgi:hypothetical protein